MKKAKRISAFLMSVAFVTMSFTNVTFASSNQNNTIITDNIVKLEETVSPEGFVHPGIGCTAETLSIMREKVLAGVSPWVDYFEGLRRTSYAKLDIKPKYVNQIVNDGGISNFAVDAQTAWTQTILYVVTGNEQYRKVPLDIIKWYGSRTDANFFPKYFPDSHIKIGKYVYTMCAAADIMRYTTPKDTSLAVTDEMIDALDKYAIQPIRKGALENNSYFMNQHSYAIMGYLASAIMADDVEGYKQVVEWTTVNATAANQGRNGSIKQVIREVTRNDKTDEAVKPNIQVVEMGRDQPHAGGNVDNLLMMAKTIDFQKTKVDPVTGTVTDKTDGVSPIHFLDDRLIKGSALFAEYNLGYGLDWIPTYSETDPNNMVTYDKISPAQRGRLITNGIPAAYYYFKGMGFDMDNGPYKYMKIALQNLSSAYEDRSRSGGFIETLHNYAFDFWIGLPATASDAAPDPEKAKRALALEIPKYESAVKGIQFENSFVDLSKEAAEGDIYPGSPSDIPLEVKNDPDGRGYVRMALGKDPRTMVAFVSFPSKAGIMVRSDKLMKLDFHSTGDYNKSKSLQTIYVPNTNNEWKYVNTNFGIGDLVYIEATSLDGTAKIDFDYINTKAEEVLPLSFDTTKRSESISAYAGATVDKTYKAICSEPNQTVKYSSIDLPEGATVDSMSGRLTWVPSAGQAGDHTIYITAQNGTSINTLCINIHVANDLQGALDYIAKMYNPNEKYETRTEKAFTSALETKDLATVQNAADQLALLTPKLVDGSLDYTKICSSNANWALPAYADGEPLSFGSIWAYDKNVTMDFGNDFKVKADAFGIQARDGFPVRVLGTVVYGSNDKVTWTLLTEKAAESSPDMQTLQVKEEEKNHPYRYIRFFMNPKNGPVLDIGEVRIYGERIEDYSSDYHMAYIKGYEDGTFKPEQNMTRAEAASLLSRLVNDYTDKGAYDCAYTDIPKDAWYWDDVAYMSQKKFITAEKDNHFNPEDNITRGDFVNSLALMNGLKGVTENKFSDITKDTPNADSINAVAQKGWVKGYADGTFRPNEPITRAEIVTALNRMLSRVGENIDAAQTFTDVDSTHWAYKDISEASTTHIYTKK